MKDRLGLVGGTHCLDHQIDLDDWVTWEEVCSNTQKPTNYKQKEFLKRLRAVHLVAMSFCGVLTPPKVLVSESGERLFECSQRDLLGVELLKKNNFRVIVLSNRKAVVELRCRRMGIECFAGDQMHSKLDILNKIMYENHIFNNQVMYIGDEINDLEVMEKAGLTVAVCDAHPKVKAIADYVTIAKGGEHAVREVAEFLLLANGHELKL